MKFRAYLKPVEFEADDEVEAHDILDAVLGAANIECNLVEAVKAEGE